MNLRKNLGRVASTIVATALLASVATVPAFADDGVWGGEGNGTITNNSIELSKELTKPAGVPTPNVTFKVTVTGVTPEKDEKAQNIPVVAGPANSVDVEENFTFAYDVDATGEIAATTVNPENGDDGDNTVTVEFNTGAFTAPGVYKYQVSDSVVIPEESTDTAEAFTCDSAYMYVFVEEAGEVEGKMTYKVINVVLTRDDTTTGKIGKLTNKYGTGDTTDKVYTVDLTKKVEGNQGATDKKFEMTITIDPSNAGDNFRVVYGSFGEGNTWVDGTTSTVIGADENYTTKVNLADGEWVRIYGLSKSDEYTIEETDYSGEGYNAYANKSYDEGDTYDKTGDSDITKASTIKDTTNENTKVAFHNVRSTTTPTGIVMNVAPYALLVVVAVAGCFVFLRKRNED